MKTLRESLLDDDLVGKTDKLIRDEIKAFLKENFDGISSCKISRKPNSDGKYEVSSTKDIKVKNKNITSLTNGMFIWTKVGGDFIVRFCQSLKSLEGAPKEVGVDFDCNYCKSLESLKGAPEKVGGSFYCYDCNKLITLEGAPKEVGGNFNCSRCKKLISLKGAPEKVGRNFSCNYCDSLESLEGAPKEVGGGFECVGCKTKFTENDVKKVSNVKEKIYCSE